MKRWKFNIILLTVLLAVLVVYVPVPAQDEEGEDPVDPIEYLETGTLYVPDSQGSTSVTKDYVYVTRENDPGIDMTAAEGQNVSATVNGEVISFLGGANVSAANGGTAALKSGNIRGGYGVWGFMNGGSLTAETGDIFAENGTALDLTLPGAGSLKVTAGDISSGASGVELITGANDDSYEPNPGDGDWLDPEDGDWEVNSDNTAAAEDDTQTGEDDEEQPAAVTSQSEISVNSVDAMQTGVDIDLVNASIVTMKANEGVFSDDKGVEINLSDAGGTVSLDTPIIEAETQGLVVNAAAGEVTVTSNDYISADSAVEITNNDGTVKLEGNPYLEGNSGIYVDATGGKTEAETSDISAQYYGVQVLTRAYDDSDPFDPAETGSSGSASEGSFSETAPIVNITVDGDITDYIDYTLPETDWDVEPDPEDPEDPEAISKSFLSAKDVEDDGSEEDSDTTGSVGILVSAETESEITIDVTGAISMSNGNEIEAADNSKVDISVAEGVVTDYGNRVGAYDGAEIKFTVDDDINAGGKALETVADSGTILAEISGDIIVQESDDGNDTAGIYATSYGDGNTTVTVSGDSGISVSSENDDTSTYGISLDNNGGEINVTVEKDVNVSGKDAVGLEIIHDPEIPEGEDEPESIITNVEIKGSLFATAQGLVFETTDGVDRKADVLVAETINGGKAGVVVSEDTVSPDNFDLTVWEIVLHGGKAATTPDGAASDIEPEIKYIIKIDPKSEDKIKAVYEDGSDPATSHDYPYQTEGKRVYVEGINGFEVTEAYNGLKPQTALEQDEDGRFFLTVPKGGAIWLAAEKFPEPKPEPTPDDGIDFYPIGDLSWLWDAELPATGFSASHAVALPVRPDGLDYEYTGFTLQIPSLDVVESIVTVPEMGGSYHVEWLDRSVGLLDKSSLPGEGVTVLTGHNHLNTTETGPFLFIGDMQEGDRIMVTDAENNLQLYKVYGNYKVASNGFAEVANEVREDALVLITCEDESVNGGYINRRVVMAEPL